ncbi:MAG: PAS domain-containing protein [Methanobacteriota archaeon]|nr:MAG: PAS domain-containing protein [Euryarchaeota archaeon]
MAESERVRVLLVDDEPEFLNLTKYLLERSESMDVQTAHSAREGLERLQEDEFDAVVSDYLMPDLDGLDMLKIVRARGSDIPFIILTGRGREDIAIEALNSGADFYVRKGVDPRTQQMDITNSIRQSVARKKAIESASNSDRILTEVLTSITDGVCVLDGNRTIKYVNPAIEAWYPHLSPLVGKKCGDVFHPDSEDEAEDCSGLGALSSACMSRKVLPRKDPEGKVVGYSEIVSFPLTKREPGESGGVIQYIRDVTALRSLEERFDLFMDYSPAFVYMKDRDGRYVYANQRFEESLGIDRNDIIGKTDEELWLSESSSESREVDERVMEERETVKTVEVVERSDGPHELLTFRFPIMDFSGECSLLGGVSVDVSDIRRYEQALVSANEKLRILGDLTRHDALNQLAALHGWLSLATSSCEDSKRTESLEKMRRAMDALRDQLEFAADYESIGAAGSEWMSVNEAVEDAKAVLADSDVEVLCEAADLYVLADPVFGRVLRNMLDNSARHGQHVSRIRIGCEETTDSLMLNIEDDGVGIPDGDKEAIFERGFGENIGIGLHITRELLRTYGMTIREVGEHGKGAVFEIRIPKDRYHFGAVSDET